MPTVLAEAKGTSASYKLKGDEIYVRLGPNVTPAPKDIHHVVTEGQSAWTIAAMYNVTLDALLEANRLERPVILKPGDMLVIPR